LANYVLYAKQGQNRELSERVVEIVNPKIVRFIKINKIDGVGFVPPSVRRSFQFIDFLKYKLDLVFLCQNKVL